MTETLFDLAMNMADQTPPSTPDSSTLQIIVSGECEIARTLLTSLTENHDGNLIVHSIGSEELASSPFTKLAQRADLLAIVTSLQTGFITDHRRMIKMATIMGIGYFLLILEGSDGDSSGSTEKEISQEFDRYIKYLSENGPVIINGVCAILGDDNVFDPDNFDLEKYLERISRNRNSPGDAFRMPIASVSDTNIISGEVISGSIDVGDKVALLPAALRTNIVAAKIGGKNVTRITKGQIAQLEVENLADISCGHMACDGANPVEVADQFETTIIWLSSDPMMSGRPYRLNSTTNTLDAVITSIKYSINVDFDEHVAANRLEKDDIGVCNISISQRVPFEPISTGRKTARFTLHDKLNDEIVGVGAIHFALRRASNVHWQALDVTRQTRAQLKGQKPAILWFTGLSGSGKSAIANIVEKKLTSLGCHTYTLDGDNIRHGLNRDLGFTDVDRVENIRRIAEVSRLMADCGLITLVSFISPFQSERQLARELAEEGEFIEIYVDTPLEVAEQRDIKGLYKKARAGDIKNFTGIDSPYEAPQNPEIRVDTVTNSAEQAAELILQKLQTWDMINLN